MVSGPTSLSHTLSCEPFDDYPQPWAGRRWIPWLSAAMVRIGAPRGERSVPLVAVTEVLLSDRCGTTLTKQVLHWEYEANKEGKKPIFLRALPRSLSLA